MFSKEKVNLGRQPELDLMKAFTVAFSMIIIHVYDWDTTLFESGFVDFLDNVSGGFYGAPIFMFAMGMGMKYSRHHSVKENAWRGLKLMAFGQALNIARYGIPFGIGCILPSHPCTPVFQILNFSSDIMQFAGLSFLLVALTWKLKMKSWQTLVLALFMCTAGRVLCLLHVQTGNYLINQFLGMFWGTHTESFFPFLTWFIFVAAGKWFAYWYQRIEDKKRFYLIATPVSTIIAVLFFTSEVHAAHMNLGALQEDPSGFSWMWPFEAIASMLTFGMPFGICYALTRILPESAIKVLSHPSKYINQYYSVSWVWITMTSIFVTVDDDGGLVYFWFNMLCCTILIVLGYNHYCVNHVEAFCGRHSKTLMLLVWVVSLGLAYYAYANYTEYPNMFNDYLFKQ